MNKQPMKTPSPTSKPSMKPKKKSKKRIVLLGIVAFVAFGVIFNMQLAKQQEIERNSNSDMEENEELKSDEFDNLAIEEKLDFVVKEYFKESSENKINYREDTKFVLIKAKGNSGWDNASTRKSMFISIKDTLKKLKDTDLETIDFNILSTTTDKYGNDSLEIVMKASFPKEVRDKINWNKFLFGNIPNIAEDYWEHPAFEN